MITLDRLRYFLEAAKLEHVGRAARKLNTSPSVISSAIKELEISLGCELFTREKRQIKLAIAGKHLVERAQKILDEVHDLEAGLSKNAGLIKGHFRVGASHFLMNGFLVPSMLKLSEKNPNFTMEFVSLDSGVATAALLNGSLDAALIFRSSYFEKLEESILYEDNFQIFVKKRHPILKLPPQKVVSALNSLHAITFRTSAGANFWEKHPIFKQIGLVPNHGFFYDDTKTAIQLLQKTNGWAFMPGMVGKMNKDIAMVRFHPEKKAPVNISIVYKSDQRLFPFIQGISDAIKAEIRVSVYQ